jgi:predicted PurR-regulated permease PerM
VNTRLPLSVTTWLVSILLTCIVLFSFQKVLWLVVPGLLALVLYYCLRPLVRAFVRAGLSPRTAARAVTGVLFLATVVALIVALPKAAARAGGWKSEVARYVQGGLNFIASTEQLLGEKFPSLRDSALLRHPPIDVRTVTEQFAEKYLGSLLLQMAHWLPSLLLMPYLTYFLLHDGNRFKKHIIRSVPNAFFEKTLLLSERIDNSLQSFFVGLMKLTFLDTVSLALGLWIFGIASPLLLGFVAAVLAWIPYVGSAVGCVLVVLVAATDFPNVPAITYGCIVLFILVRLLDDFIFLPLTIGRSLHIHPVLSVLMLFLGATVAGPTGLVLVLPVLGVVVVVTETLGQIVSDRCLRERFWQAQQLRAAPKAIIDSSADR